MLFKMTTTIRNTDIHAVVKQCESGQTYVVVFRNDQKLFEYCKDGYCTEDLKYIIDRKLLTQINLN